MSCILPSMRALWLSSAFTAMIAALFACTSSPKSPSASGPFVRNAPVAAMPHGPTDTFETASGGVALYPIYHGTVALRFDDTMVVIDPWSKAPQARLPQADLVLITDIHRDHFDPKGIEAVKKPDTIIVAPQAVANDLSEAKVLANGDRLQILGIEIEAIPMYNHKRGPKPGKLFHDKGRGNGYLLNFGGKRFYISGDTACTDEMRALQNVDAALICMNLPYTMPPEEAAECVKAFRPKVAIPFHYRNSDTRVFAKALEKEPGIEVRLRNFYDKVEP